MFTLNRKHLLRIGILPITLLSLFASINLAASKSVNFDEKEIFCDETHHELNTSYNCRIPLVSPYRGQVLPQVRLNNGKYQSRWHFKWRPCSGATRYHLYVIGPNARNPVVNNSNIRRLNFSYYSSEHYGITKTQGWKWQVRALVNGRWGPWSEVGFFNVSPKSGTDSSYSPRECKVQLISPANNSRLYETRGNDRKYYTNWTFSWENCPNASFYQLYVIGPGAKNPLVNVNNLRTTYYRFRRSSYGVTKTEGWKWYVRAYVNGRWGSWSDPRFFGVSSN